MATYHTAHEFAPGFQTTTWNMKTRRYESTPCATFCKVCGRKADHMLHGAK